MNEDHTGSSTKTEQASSVPEPQECECPVRKAAQTLVDEAGPITCAVRRTHINLVRALSAPCPCTQLRQENHRLKRLRQDWSALALEARAERDALRTELAKAQRDAVQVTEEAAWATTEMASERDAALSLLDQAREALAPFGTARPKATDGPWFDADRVLDKIDAARKPKGIGPIL